MSRPGEIRTTTPPAWLRDRYEELADGRYGWIGKRDDDGHDDGYGGRGRDDSSDDTNVIIPTPAFTSHTFSWQRAVWDHVVDHPQVTHRIIVVHRRGRKTTLGLNLLIQAGLKADNTTHAYISPTINETKRVVVRDPMMLKRYLPDAILAKPFNETDLYAELVNGSIIHFGGADQPDRWRGTGCRTWWLDEFAMMRHGMQFYDEIIAPIQKDNTGNVFFSYTPKGRNCGWEIIKRAKDRDDWAVWHLPATKTERYNARELGRIRQDTPERIYSQEFMCAFLVDGGGVFRRVRECITGEITAPTPGGRYIMGVDLAKRQDWTVLTVLNRDTRHVDAFDRFQQVDWGLQKIRIARLAREYNNALIILDSTGVGDPIEDDLRQLGLSVRGEKIWANRHTSRKRQLIEGLMVAIEGRRFTFPNIPELVQELEDYDIDEHARYGAPEGLHDDTVISAALAVEGLGAEVYHDQVQVDAEERHRRQEEREIARQSINAGFGD